MYIAFIYKCRRSHVIIIHYFCTQILCYNIHKVTSVFLINSMQTKQYQKHTHSQYMMYCFPILMSMERNSLMVLTEKKYSEIPTKIWLLAVILLFLQPLLRVSLKDMATRPISVMRCMMETQRPVCLCPMMNIPGASDFYCRPHGFPSHTILLLIYMLWAKV